MAKLNKVPRRGIHSALQDAIVAAINDPNYSFSLPKLSDWESIVSSTVDEKQRLEFVGDAVMHLSVALYLYRLFPDAAPGLYTNIRSAVNANATFTHLMVKAGAYELPSQSHSTKAAADSFEVIVAALYMERGFADVCAWVQEQYAPLIAAARESYDKCLTTSVRNIPLWPNKRRRAPLDPAGMPLLKKIRLSSGRSSPRATLMAQRVINRMKSKGKVKLCFPTKKTNVPLEKCLRSYELRIPESQGPSSIVIDLTADSDSDGDEEQPSQSNIKPLASTQSRILLPQSYPSSRRHQSPAGRTTFLCHPKQGPVASGSLYRTFGLPSSSSSTTAASSRHVTPIIPQATSEFLRRSSLVLPLQLDISPSGTYGDPIIIEDSETES